MQTPSYRKTTDVTVDTARDVCAQTKVDPTSLAVGGHALISGKIETDSIATLTDSLVRSSGATPAAQLEGLLVATVGSQLAKRLLNRRQAGSAWGKVVDLMQNGAATAKLEGEAAVKLAKELRSAAAVIFKEQISKDPTAEGLAKTINDGAAHLSPNCMTTIVRDVVATKSIAVRNAADQALQRFAIASEINTVLERPGDATQLRTMRPADMINDEVLFLDAFEVFVHANDTALKCIADSSQHALDALREGDDFTVHSNGQSLLDIVATLKDEVRRMMEWQQDLSHGLNKRAESARDRSSGFVKDADGIKGAYDNVMEKLDAATEALSNVFVFNAHGTGYSNFSADLASGLIPPQVAGPYEAFTAICSKSKANVEIDSIETVEELIRILHREVAHMFAEHVRHFAKQKLTLRKSHNYNNASETRPKNVYKRALNMTYIGSHTKETFNQTPMAVARDVILDYVKSTKNGGYAIDDAILTDKTLAFDTRLGAHRGRLAVTYDSAHKLYFVEWGMQEPGTQRRIPYCKTLLEKEGYKHSVEGYKHSASRKVTPENIEHELSFLLFTLDNLKNVDISSENLDPESLRKMFISWYNHKRVKPTVDAGAPREQKIAQLAAQDPHIFNAAAVRGSSGNGRNAAVQFYAKHFDVLGRIGASAETVKADLTAVADHYYNDLAANARAHMNPSKWRAEERDREAEREHFDAVATAVAECKTRDAIHGVFGSDKSVKIQGPIYQST